MISMIKATCFFIWHSCQLCHCVSPSLSVSGKGCVACYWTHSHLKLWSTHSWSCFALRDRGSLISCNLYRPSTCSGSPVSGDSWWLLCPQQTECQRMIRRDFISPFLDKFIHFVISWFARSPFVPLLSWRRQSGRWSFFGKWVWFTESHIVLIILVVLFTQFILDTKQWSAISSKTTRSFLVN